MRYKGGMAREFSQVSITHLDSRGLGRGTVAAGDGTTREVVAAGTLPGDLVDLRLRRRKQGVYHTSVTRLQREGVARIEPFCRHFADCGGCTVQDLSYAQQLAMKHAMVSAAFREAGMERLPSLPPVLPAPRGTHYRNKLEFSFGAQRWLSDDEIAGGESVGERRGLGFHVAGRFDRVLDLQECHLQGDPSELVRSRVRSYALERGLSFYDARAHTGLLRLLMVRTTQAGESMVVLMFGEDDPAAVRQVMDDCAALLPEVDTLGYVVNTTGNDSIFPHEVHIVRGPGYLSESCGPNRLRIRPKAFYQTNPEQAVQLYETALAMTGLRREDRVLDLYCGIGSIALLLARRVASVVGVESVADAVTAARENAQLNGITNAVFEAGEVETVLPDILEREGHPDLVVVDPPRVGLHPRARRVLGELGAQRLLYISCNPRSQASDLAELAGPDGPYELSALQPVDMFPQTRHVENIAVLHRRQAPR